MKKLITFLSVLAVAFTLYASVPVVDAGHLVQCKSIKYISATSSQADPPGCDQTGETSVCPAFGGVVNVSYPCSPTTATGLLAIINKIFTILFIFLITIASFSLLYAAFLYVTSEGEEEKIKTAKKIIIYAIVALIVAALAWGAPRAVQNFIA